jgi:NAD+ kinase
VIIATPTGSTAYSMAANGPILHPAMRGAVVLTPICPHTLTQRPIVLPDDMNLDITLRSPGEVVLSLDGQGFIKLERTDRVQVKQSANRVLLVANPHMDYFGILRAKLKWGER